MEIRLNPSRPDNNSDQIIIKTIKTYYSSMNTTQFMAIVPFVVKSAIFSELTYKRQECTEEQI